VTTQLIFESVLVNRKELAVSKRFNANLMHDMNSIEQQVRKIAEEPVINWYVHISICWYYW